MLRSGRGDSDMGPGLSVRRSMPFGASWSLADRMVRVLRAPLPFDIEHGNSDNPKDVVMWAKAEDLVKGFLNTGFLGSQYDDALGYDYLQGFSPNKRESARA